MRNSVYIQMLTYLSLIVSLAVSVRFQCDARYEPSSVKTELPVITAEAVKNLPVVDICEPKETSTDEDVELIALVAMAEAEGECEEGQRLVIDTILNRVDSAYFPNTIYDVIYQPYQFSSMWNGRVERCEVREELCRLVREEMKSRTNYDVIFFSAGNYSKYGIPLFRVEHHYFSKYE